MTYFIALILFTLVAGLMLKLLFANIELEQELAWYKADRENLVLQVASMAGKLGELSFFAKGLK